ncbi:MAG: hypothetical protein R3B13_16965 [Polyangiaceae bacterium]
MRYCVSALAVLFVVFFANSAHAEDDWFGQDKALHFGASATIAGGGYALSTTFLEPRVQRALFGGGLALVAGAGKEAYDATGAGSPSYRDFTWDVIGAATGVAIAWLIDLAIAGDPPARRPAESTSARRR